MASGNKFESGLNNWQLTDRPKMDDFNMDNQIIDTAIRKIGDIPSWALSAAPPAYTADDVGAVALEGSKASAAQTSAALVRVTNSRKLVTSDAGRQIEVDSANDIVITIPLDSEMNLSTQDTEIEITREGTGEVTIAPASGVTLHSPSEKRAVAEQYASVSLKQRGPNDWRMEGNLK